MFYAFLDGVELVGHDGFHQRSVSKPDVGAAFGFRLTNSVLDPFHFDMDHSDPFHGTTDLDPDPAPDPQH